VPMQMKLGICQIQISQSDCPLPLERITKPRLG
jgi:hypothetical protein